MRSPVSTIRHHAEVALAHSDGVSVPDLASVVLEEDLRIQSLVDDLLLLARLDEGESVTRSEPVDLDDLVFEAARRLNAGDGPRVDVSGVGGGRVAGDRGRLAKLVGNLIDNAVRHAHANVIVSLREQESTVVLRVDDDGSGIDERDRTRIFERFVRLDEARGRDAGGSGLGLAIVAEVARIHGGTVEVGDSPSGGARFGVSFAALTD
jgi:signal transduction histidine kinase